MAVPRHPRLLALAWLAVALWLAATGGCLCRHVHPTPAPYSVQPPPAPYSVQPPPADAPHVPAVPTPARHFHPRPICRGPFCPPPIICPQEGGCSGQEGSP